MHVVFECPHVFLKAVVASNEIPSVTPKLLRVNHESLASHAAPSVAIPDGRTAVRRVSKGVHMYASRGKGAYAVSRKLAYHNCHGKRLLTRVVGNRQVSPAERSR